MRKLLLIIALSYLVCGCIKTSDPKPNSTDNSTQGTSNGNNGGTTNATNTTPDTYFLAYQNYAVNNNGAYLTQQFNLNAQTTLVLRFASKYKSQAAVIADSQYGNFTGMKSFLGYALFDGKIGTQQVTLAPGSYYLAVRNMSSGPNEWSVELDKAISLPASDQISFVDDYLSTANSFNAGTILSQAFTIQDGYRYFIDGCNVGFGVYIINEDQLDNFKSGNQFTYYSDYTSGSGGDPGLAELKLPAGNYYIAATSSGPSSITYTLERWKRK